MMAKPQRKHFVEFESPGTFVHESSVKPIESWDPVAALAMAETIKERYGATPFAFSFLTEIVAEPIPDGEGGTLEVEPKEVKRSGRYFLGGIVESIEDVKKRGSPDERILLSNMEGNGWPYIITVIRGYKSTHRFDEDDCIVGPDGKVTMRGNDSELMAHREKVKASMSRGTGDA